MVCMKYTFFFQLNVYLLEREKRREIESKGEDNGFSNSVAHPLNACNSQNLEARTCIQIFHMTGRDLSNWARVGYPLGAQHKAGSDTAGTLAQGVPSTTESPYAKMSIPQFGFSMYTLQMFTKLTLTKLMCMGKHRMECYVNVFCTLHNIKKNERIPNVYFPWQNGRASV